MLESRLASSSGMPMASRRRERQMISPASLRMARKRALSIFFLLLVSGSAIGGLYGRGVGSREWVWERTPHRLLSVLLPLPTPHSHGSHFANHPPNGVASMTLVNSLCAEISIYQGVGEQTGVLVERSAIRGKKGLW